MRRIKTTVKIITITTSIVCLVLFSAIAFAYGETSSQYNVVQGKNLVINCNIPLVVKSKNYDVALQKADFDNDKYDVELSLLGIIPLRRATVNVVDEGKVYVLGSSFGMKVYTDGVLVVNLSDVDTADGNKSPAKESGLRINDSIVTIDGKKVYTNEEVAKIIEKSNGNPLETVIKRDGEFKIITLIPQLSKSSKTYKAGIWVRDSSAGIGTLTFYLPSEKIVCGLGHSINDTDTGEILQISSGEIVKSEVISVSKAEKGSPGELRGRLMGEKYGKMLLNCNCGVYALAEKEISQGELLPIALKQEITDGQAYIYTCVSGENVQKFSCEIKVNRSDSSKSDMSVKITDENLLSATGGIVQGMSGSPVVQNGKLIGAVTHVLVDDPTTGYAIFAENMLETAQNVANENKLKDVS